ncbi:Thioredoxin-like fold,Alkyl hydroperoxide reductase subunit C/ Thiol specific antioxidant, partial [Cinara cedri]
SKVCLTELLALCSKVSEFRALHTEIVACSVDSYYSHQAWYRELQSTGKYAIPELPLLSDPTHAISKSYGCYLPELGHSLRAHYIIDTRGILRHVTINDLAVGRNIKEIIRLIQAFQYTD